MSSTAARLRLVVAALLFSTGGAALKATSLTAWQTACFRSGVAAAAVWLLVPAARRRWDRRIVAIGCIFAATMILFVLANRLTTSANAIFLQSTAPLWVLLAGPFVLRERATRDDVVLMLVIAAGMTLFFVGTDPPQTTAPDPARGNLLAVVSGVFYAGTVLGLRWIGRGRDTTTISAPGSDAIACIVAGNAIACLVTLPMALPAPAVHLADVAVVLYLGIVQIGLAYLALSTAMPHVPAIEASTLLLVEPALNPVWAYLVHGERPSTLAWAGGALIVLGAAARTAWDARQASAARTSAARVPASSTVHLPPD